MMPLQVEIIRAEELHRRSASTSTSSLYSFSDSDPSNSPPPMQDEPASPTNSTSDTSTPSSPRRGRTTRREHRTPRRRNEGDADADDGGDSDTVMQPRRGNDGELSPIPSPISPPRKSVSADADSPLQMLAQCNSATVRAFLTNFLSQSPMPMPMPHLSASPSDPGHWQSTGTSAFTPLDRRSSIFGLKKTTTRRQLDLGSSSGAATCAAEDDNRRYSSHNNSCAKDVDMSPISEIEVADCLEYEQESNKDRKDARSKMPNTNTNTDVKHASEFPHRNFEEDDTEKAMSEHAKALLNLQALDDSVQAICDLDMPSKRRRCRSEPDIGHLEVCFIFFNMR